MSDSRLACQAWFRSLVTARRKRIALIAHDNMKPDILEWATYNRGTLGRHELFATGTTGACALHAAKSREDEWQSADEPDNRRGDCGLAKRDAARDTQAYRDKHGNPDRY